VKAVDCITNEMLVTAWQETEYHADVCRATNDVHFEMYRTHKKLCEARRLKMNQFIKYTLWLKICNVLFYCHLRSDTLYM
jgi:hypothetical protein